MPHLAQPEHASPQQPELHFCSRLNHLEYMPTFICTRCPRWCQLRSRSNCSVADWTRCPSIPHSIVWPHFGYWAAHWDWKRHCEQSGGTKKGSSRQGEGVQEKGSQHIHIFINYHAHHYLGMLCTAKLINRCSVQSHPSTYSVLHPSEMTFLSALSWWWWWNRTLHCEGEQIKLWARIVVPGKQICLVTGPEN